LKTSPVSSHVWTTCQRDEFFEGGHTTLARGKITRDSVRVAVIGRQGDGEISATKEFDVTRVITKQLNHTHRFERLKLRMHSPGNLINRGIDLKFSAATGRMLILD
jgi:hypothetical protein